MTTPPALSLPDAERLAERTEAEIIRRVVGSADYRHYLADRERVVSDLAGLRRHAPDTFSQQWTCTYCVEDHDSIGLLYRKWPCPDAQDRSDNLRRTAALYGVTDA